MGKVAPMKQAVDLLVPDTGELLARLATPRASNLYSLRFAPDGSQLFVLEWDQQIQVWDLRQIRTGLCKLGLGWNSPSFPDETAKSGLQSDSSNFRLFHTLRNDFDTLRRRLKDCKLPPVSSGSPISP